MCLLGLLWNSVFTAAGSDKAEVKDQKVQTEAVEIRNQHVQADTTDLEQGTSMLTHDIFILSGLNWTACNVINTHAHKLKWWGNTWHDPFKIYKRCSFRYMLEVSSLIPRSCPASHHLQYILQAMHGKQVIHQKTSDPSIYSGSQENKVLYMLSILI